MLFALCFGFCLKHCDMSERAGGNNGGCAAAVATSDDTLFAVPPLPRPLLLLTRLLMLAYGMKARRPQHLSISLDLQKQGSAEKSTDEQTINREMMNTKQQQPSTHQQQQ